MRVWHLGGVAPLPPPKSAYVCENVCPGPAVALDVPDYVKLSLISLIW